MIRQRNTEQTGTNIHRIIRNSGERNHQAIKLNKNRKTHIRKLRKKDRRPPGGARSGTHGGAGISGSHGGSASEAASPAPRPLRLEPYYQVYKKIIGESRGYPRALGGALEARTLRGALKARTLGGTGEGPALEGAREEWALGGAHEEQALGGALAARTLGGTVEEPALEVALGVQARYSAFRGASTGGRCWGVGSGAGLQLIPSYATSKPRGTWTPVGGLAVAGGIVPPRTASWVSHGRRRLPCCRWKKRRKQKTLKTKTGRRDAAYYCSGGSSVTPRVDRNKAGGST